MHCKKQSLAAALGDPRMGTRHQCHSCIGAADSIPDHLDAEAGHVKIYSIFSLGSEKALPSKMKNSMKKREKKAEEDSLFCINGRKGELTCQGCWAEGASLCNLIPSPEREGSGMGRDGVLLVFLNKTWCHCWPFYEGQKDQKNIFTFSAYLPFKFQKGTPPTIMQKSQTLSKFTHCEGICNFQVSYSHEKQIHRLLKPSVH